ncbi:hypothetical protein SAMN05428982_2946 [Pseudoxanthomonas sp. CF385]|uniref:DUF1993 domain-containing protein n=1 Tax=Pseudoxanthomonas sp. CF385 TaxID=1881042 RepID=UPI00087EC9F8|nr:DUF1993 domain-containing protein [Pseudoxanthomonas sp. CF385]SDR02676.1 hypothetical protein SAMN05428982_2946 [Pseudoxanthomonas sp. CF385]
MSTALSMHQASVPVLLRALKNLRHVLEKGEAHAREKGYEPTILLQSRLAPDMLPLVRQVQIATDTAKFAVARLSATESPRFEDAETTFDELYARLEAVAEYLRTFDDAALAGSEDRRITLTTRTRGELVFDGRGYLFGFVLPNVFFHLTTAYAILRHNGVPLGKLDYLGPDA